MVKIEFIRSDDERADFGDNANIKLSTIVEPDMEVYNKTVNDQVEKLYEGTTIYSNFGAIYSAVEESLNNYNHDLVASIFDSIVSYNQQTYYDIMTIVKILIECANQKEKVKFMKDMKQFIDSTYSKESEEEKDEEEHNSENDVDVLYPQESEDNTDTIDTDSSNPDVIDVLPSEES